MSSFRHKGSTRIIVIFVVTCAVFLAVFSFWFLPKSSITYTDQYAAASSSFVASATPQIVHLKTPEPLKAIYMTSWAAGNDKFRKELFDIVSTTEVNAVVIDVKDYTGKISFIVEDSELASFGASENRIPDIKDFIKKLHEKGVYVIARISSFQDSFLIKSHPEWAVKTKEGNVWADYKGVKWLDTGAEPVWKYLVMVGKEAYADGFDELNFDYIRYPSDGNMKDISYSWSNGRSRREVLRSFFKYLREELSPIGIPISVDLFGLTTTNSDDLGIGQNLLDALEYFDYVSPMVYPSHFAHGFIGYEKPAEHPYDVVYYSMKKAAQKAVSTTTTDYLAGIDMIASTTPKLYTKNPVNMNKLRPWLQAFDLGAIYTPAMVRTQIQATYDSGLTSWLLWDAACTYDKRALESRSTQNGERSTE
jgi:hypothetical protein